MAVALGACAAVVLGNAAWAETQPTPAPNTQPAAEAPPITGKGALADEEIVVPGGERLREVVRDFVDQISEPAKDGQLARFDDRVCPGVVGAPQKVAQALVDQIALRANELKLRVGEPGCKANILIVVASDSQSFTPDFVRTNGRLFGVNDRGTRGSTALRAFTDTPRVVRWWHVTETVTDAGFTLGSSDASGGEGSISGAQVARVTNAGRLRAGTRQDVNRVIIIVDATKAAAAPFPAMADYLALVSLAQVNPDVRFDDTPSVLALWSDIAAGRVPVSGWTEWDKGYLEGLYGAPRYAKSSNLQESAITNSMTEDLTKPLPEDPPKQ